MCLKRFFEIRGRAEKQENGRNRTEGELRLAWGKRRTREGNGMEGYCQARGKWKEKDRRRRSAWGKRRTREEGWIGNCQGRRTGRKRRRRGGVRGGRTGDEQEQGRKVEWVMGWIKSMIR